MKESKKRKRFSLGRNWILIILAVYLLALAAFTLLSNMILQNSVPHVNSYRVDWGEINGECYDKVIPLSAINSDERMKDYVMEVVRKDTPLGERCYLNQVGVTILKTDPSMEYCAVSFSLQVGDEIVTECDSSYKDTDIVVVEKSKGK